MWMSVLIYKVILPDQACPQIYIIEKDVKFFLLVLDLKNHL